MQQRGDHRDRADEHCREHGVARNAGPCGARAVCDHERDQDVERNLHGEECARRQRDLLWMRSQRLDHRRAGGWT